MGGATLAIGLLPDARTIGSAAPVLLTLLRLLQGLSAAGEQSGSNSLTLEHSSGGRRAYFTSWTLTGTQAGAILATGVHPRHLPARGAIAELGLADSVPAELRGAGVVAYLVRRTMPETPAFSEIKEKHELARFPVLALLRDYCATCCG